MEKEASGLLCLKADGAEMRTQKRCMGYMAIVVDDYDRAIEY